MAIRTFFSPSVGRDAHIPPQASEAVNLRSDVGIAPYCEILRYAQNDIFYSFLSLSIMA